MSKPFPEVTRSQQNTANSPSSNKTPANTLRSTANTIADFFVGGANLEGLTKFVKSNKENLGVFGLSNKSSDADVVGVVLEIRDFIGAIDDKNKSQEEFRRLVGLNPVSGSNTHTLDWLQDPTADDQNAQKKFFYQRLMLSRVGGIYRRNEEEEQAVKNRFDKPSMPSEGITPTEAAFAGAVFNLFDERKKKVLSRRLSRGLEDDLEFYSQISYERAQKLVSKIVDAAVLQDVTSEAEDKIKKGEINTNQKQAYIDEKIKNMRDEIRKRKLAFFISKSGSDSDFTREQIMLFGILEKKIKDAQAKSQVQVDRVLDLLIGMNDAEVLNEINSFKLESSLKLGAGGKGVIARSKIRLEEGRAAEKLMNSFFKDGAGNFKAINKEPITQGKVVETSGYPGINKLTADFDGFGSRSKSFNDDTNSRVWNYSKLTSFNNDYEDFARGFLTSSSTDFASQRTMATIPGYEEANQYVSIIGFNSAAAGYPGLPSATMKVFISEVTARKQIEASRKISQEAADYVNGLNAAEFALTALQAKYYEALKNEGNRAKNAEDKAKNLNKLPGDPAIIPITPLQTPEELAESDQMRQMRKAIEKRKKAIDQLKVSPVDNGEVVAERMKNFVKHDFSLSAAEESFLDDKTKARFYELQAMVGGNAVAKESKGLVDKLASRVDEYRTSKQLTKNILASSSKITLSKEEVESFTDKFNSLINKAKIKEGEKHDADDFRKILTAPVMSPFGPDDDGIAIIKPNRDEAGSLELLGRKRQHADGRATVAVVIFSGAAKGEAHVHIPGSSELYYVARRALFDGDMDVRGPDGKMTKYSKLHGGELVKKGQIVIDKCPVRRVGKNHVGQPISKMESQERDLCKAFSIKAVSTRDGVVQDTAMLFKGEFCSAQGIEIRRRFKFKTTYSGFEISGSTPINGSGSFDKLSVRVHEKGGKIIPDPNIDSALDNDDQNFFESLGIDESNVTNKELAETQHFPESEDNAEFRVVVPVYLQQDGTTSRGKPVLQIVNQNSPSGFDTKELTTENLAEIFDADPDDKEVEKLYEKCLHFAHNKNINIAIVGQDGKSRRSHLLSSVNGNNELLQVETPSSSCRATYVSAVGPKLGAGKFIVAAA